ncbi:uncharacterized protein A4U43_C07F37040 [Asparagus officinalis]|uniref:Plastid lipid-associated protein/fibrillin conserved domain-containing protein n=1 Tax=Asparagus officinalis TaxID=4686 RepID=A0A5P1EN12_ASPOF|nr:probable plastid-lipid-associated protein 4, chloroplastic [Asparagus officinalis]ONK65430.1 uncharacterized protein A4U43_C07F37040 [Asparagus officinalis]
MAISLMASLTSPLPPSSPLSSDKTHRNPNLVASNSPSCSVQLPFDSKPKSPIELSNPLAVPKWRTKVSFFPSFLKKKGKSKDEIKQELFEAIAPLDRGAEATIEDQERIEQIVRELEAANSIKEPLKSDLLNGKWELIYTTSSSILQSKRPKILRPSGKIYQAINADTLRAQNMETWPYFNQVTADLTPLNPRKVAVKFDTFKILGLIPIKAPDTARGELEITYLDEEIRISRGDKGNLFILKMADPSYRVPL